MGKPGKQANPKKRQKAQSLPAPKAAIRPRKATDKEALFAKHYAVSRNGRLAAIAAGYSEPSATVTASKLIRKPKVQDLINRALNEALDKAQANVDFVVRRWLSIASADPRELVENLHDACRYCWGEGNKYHWTAREFERAQDSYRLAIEEWNERDEEYRKKYRSREPKEPDIAGGLGYDPRREPNQECPECFGRGVLYQHLADTRFLSDSARMLYAGVEVTQHGIRMKLRDPEAAVTNLAKHLGMLAERHLHGGLPPDFWEKATPEQLKAVAEGKKPV